MCVQLYKIKPGYDYHIAIAIGLSVDSQMQQVPSYVQCIKTRCAYKKYVVNSKK